jgi:drug/metabolite transporter (DMT)-like permease
LFIDDAYGWRTLSLAMLAGILLAAVSSVATAFSFLLKHRGARTAVAVSARRPLRSIRSLFASGWFAVGFAVALVAGAVHIGALALAPLSTVQAVIAGGLVMLGVFAVRLFAHTLTPRQWLGVALAACGLVLLAVVFPTGSASSRSFSGAGLAAFASATASGALLLLLVLRRGLLAGHRGVALGAASGLFFGLGDMTIKAAADAFSTPHLLVGALGLIGVVAAAGLAAQFTSARGLQLGDAVPVTALTTSTATVTAIAAGVAVFHDPLPHGALALAGELVGFALVSLAALLTPIRIPPATPVTNPNGHPPLPPTTRTPASLAAPTR